jgi:hypothetical protein
VKGLLPPFKTLIMLHSTAVSDQKRLNCFPQLVTVTPRYEPSRIASFEQRILAILTAEEATEWRESVARAKTDETFSFALPHHCAVGTKPN